MDEIGQRYLLLVLRLGRHMPDTVHAYTGPPALKEVVDGEALTPVIELHDEAMRIIEVAEMYADGQAASRRAAFLRSQLTSIGTMARLLGGEEITFADRVELLLGCPFERPQEPVFEAATMALSNLLPGGGPLLERVEQHDATLTPPRDRRLGEVKEFASVLQRRSAQEWGLPAGEAVEWIAIRRRPYAVSAGYLGNRRSRIEINIDFPLTVSDMLDLVAHEAYPGHHLERATKASRTASDGGRGESMVIVSCTPQMLVLEGMAEHALQLAMTEPEIGSELAAAVGRNGLRGDLGIDRAAARTREVLDGAVVAAALGRTTDGWTQRATSDYLREVYLASADVANRWASQFDDPIRGIQPLSYPMGRALAGKWLEVVGQSDGARRYLHEDLGPSQLLADIGEPRALYPGSLV
jgi:hypothetical protein